MFLVDLGLLEHGFRMTACTAKAVTELIEPELNVGRYTSEQ